MKRTALTFALALAYGHAFAFDANADFKKFATGMIPKVEKAFAKKDIAFFTAMSTADFTIVDAGTEGQKKEAMAGLKGFFDAAKTIKATFKIKSSKSDGKTATLVLSNHTVATMKPQAEGAKSSQMTVDAIETQTWVKTSVGWRLKRLVRSEAKMTMDGKPFGD